MHPEKKILRTLSENRIGRKDQLLAANSAGNETDTKSIGMALMPHAKAQQHKEIEMLDACIRQSFKCLTVFLRHSSFK